MNHMHRNLHCNGHSKKIFYLLLSLTLTACTQLSPVFRTEPDQQAPLSAIEYYLWVKSAPASVINRTYRQIESQKEAYPVVRLVKLALLLSVPEKAGSKAERAALGSLEQAIVSEDSDVIGEIKDYQQFALLWRDILKQRQELRRLNTELSGTLADKNTELQTLTKENQEYLEKINALKSIEKQMNHRIESLGPPHE